MGTLDPWTAIRVIGGAIEARKGALLCLGAWNATRDLIHFEVE